MPRAKKKDANIFLDQNCIIVLFFLFALKSDCIIFLSVPHFMGFLCTDGPGGAQSPSAEEPPVLPESSEGKEGS